MLVLCVVTGSQARRLSAWRGRPRDDPEIIDLEMRGETNRQLPNPIPKSRCAAHGSSRPCHPNGKGKAQPTGPDRSRGWTGRGCAWVSLEDGRRLGYDAAVYVILEPSLSNTRSQRVMGDHGKSGQPTWAHQAILAKWHEPAHSASIVLRPPVLKIFA
jgi:hypothetical protein